MLYEVITDKNKLIIPYCAVGIRSYIASRILIQNGFRVKNLAGGYPIYSIYTGDYTANNSAPTKSAQTAHNKVDAIKTADLSNSLNPTSVEDKSGTNGGSSKMKDDSITKFSETIKVNACGLQCRNNFV